jgi:hypothetical protein
MKRLITFLGAAILFVCVAFGQTPMLVAGNMKIVGANTNVKSQGNVIVSQGGKIHNKGTLNLPGGITFLSEVDPGGVNTGWEGILWNDENATVTYSSTPNKVTVVKKFKTAGKFYSIAFPFDVKISEITTKATGKTVIYRNEQDQDDDGFWIKYYDVVNRAHTAQMDESWKYINDANAVLQAGEGYMIYVDVDNVEITFPAVTLSADIGSYDRTKKLVYTPNEGVVESNAGWNSIGNLQTTLFNIKENISVGGVKEFNIYLYSDYGWTHYVENDLVVWSPFVGGFIQIRQAQDAKNIGFGGSGRQLDGSALRFDGTSSKSVLKLTLQGRDAVDKLHIMERESYSNDYTLGEDALKLFGSSKAEFYTMVEQFPMAVNRFKSIDRQGEIPIGLKVKEKGTYTIGIDDLQGFEDDNIYLIDKDRNQKINLRDESYVFDSDVVDTKARFALRFDRSETGLRPGDANIIVYAKDNVVYVKNINAGDEVSVYNIAGQLMDRSIASSSEQSSRLQGAGVYIVKVTGAKTFVSKVINK